KFPFLIIFFQRTIELLLIDYEEVGGGNSKQGLLSYFQKEEFEKRKLRMADWVSEVTGEIISEEDKPVIEKLIGLVAYSYFDFLGRSRHLKNADLYYNSLALPKN